MKEQVNLQQKVERQLNEIREVYGLFTSCYYKIPISTHPNKLGEVILYILDNETIILKTYYYIIVSNIVIFFFFY